MTVVIPQVGFDPPGKKWQLCLNIVVALPPKPPRVDLTMWLFFEYFDPGFGQFLKQCEFNKLKYYQ